MSWVDTQKHVYFMRSVGKIGPVKIGCSAYLGQRLTALSIWSPFPLEILASAPGPHTLERFLHRKYAEQRSHSEWFHPTQDMLRRIALVTEGMSIEDAFEAEKDPSDDLASTPRYRERDRSLMNAVRERISFTDLAAELGITKSAVAQWDRVPGERVGEVSRITGLSVEEMRPDWFEIAKGKRQSTSQPDRIAS